MPAGIAFGIGVDADELQLAHLDAGLLLELAAAGILDRLADLDEPAW